MSKQLNALEKEFLIKRFKERTDVKISDFCEVNGISVSAFKKWLSIYNEEGLEGLNKGKGGISYLTHDEISRIDLTRNAFIMALIEHINGDMWR